VLKTLLAQQAQMDARLKIQQDQQAMLTAALPASTATPNSGAFTVTGTPFPSQKLAYEKLNLVATDIAAEVITKVTAPGPVLVYDQAEISSLINYKALSKVLTALQTQVTTLRAQFNNSLDPQAQALLKLPKAEEAEKALAPILIPALALGGLKTVSDLIGMFRTSTNIAFSSFTADDAALTAAVGRELIAQNIAVFEPSVMPLGMMDAGSPFMDQLSAAQIALMTMQEQAGLDQSKVQQVSDALGAYIQADQACQTNQDLTAAETDTAKKTALQTKQAGLDRVREAARLFVVTLLGDATAALDPATANTLKAQRDQFVKVLAAFVNAITPTATAFGTLQTSLMAVTATGSSTLTAILRAEKLAVEATKPNAAILLVKTSVLGGSVVTRVNLFTGGHLLYTGGAIANYTLFNSAGAVVASGIVVKDKGSDTDKF
jgi:hypothetical protein